MEGAFDSFTRVATARSTIAICSKSNVAVEGLNIDLWPPQLRPKSKIAGCGATLRWNSIRQLNFVLRPLKLSSQTVPRSVSCKGVSHCHAVVICICTCMYIRNTSPSYYLAILYITSWARNHLHFSVSLVYWIFYSNMRRTWFAAHFDACAVCTGPSFLIRPGRGRVVFQLLAVRRNTGSG